MRLLRIRGLEKVFASEFEELVVLRHVEMDLDAGSTVVISGESGCGKSTLLNLIGGLDTPTGGTIEVHGDDICTMEEERLSRYRNRMIGYVFQFHYLLRDFTAEENVMMPGHIAGMSARECRRRARSLLDDVGLLERSNHYSFELSGGERQRVAVARALMNDPALILADEPTGNLDERTSGLVADRLFDLVERYGKSMVLVTHDRSLRSRGDTRFVLEHGTLHGA